MSRRLLWVVTVLGGVLLLGMVVRWRSREGRVPGRGTPSTPESGAGRLVPPGSPGGAAPAIPVMQENPSGKMVHSLDREKATRIVRQLAAKHAKAYRGRKEEIPALFAREVEYRYREGRLLAMAFPGVIEEAATALATDASADRQERIYGLLLLSQLAKNGSATAKDMVFRLAYSSEESIADTALATAPGWDPEGANKDLYWSRCRQWNTIAFSIVGRWLDPGTISLMKEVVSTVPQGADSPRGECRWMAQDVLRQMEVLASPNPDEGLAAVIRREGDPSFSSSLWALDVAERRGGDFLKGVLKERLEAGIREAERVFGALARPGEPPMELNREFATSTDFPRIAKDEMYDHVLLAYWKTGAPLSDLQKARLRTFGYACDPLERLLELMPELR